MQSGATILTDAPTDNEGRGEAFSPTDLLSAALGSCMLTIMGIGARAHGFSIDGTEVEVTKVMGVSPRRVVEVVIEFTFVEVYGDKHRRVIEAAARECPVARSLHPDLKQTLVFHYPRG